MLLKDINKFIEENEIKQITTANIIKAEKYDDNGLFSNIIFGLPNSSRWRTKYGYIALNTRVLHPLLYEIADRRASLLIKFFDGEVTMNPDTGLIEKNSMGYYGIPFFIEHLDKVCAQLLSGNGLTEAGQQLIKYILKHRDLAFIENMIVLPPQFRPVNIVRNKVELTPINNYYASLINDANVVRFAQGNNFRTVTNKIQQTVYKIYHELTNLIKGKQGAQRGALLSKVMDFSARAVITGDINIEPNTIGVPENLALVLFKNHIIHDLVYGDKRGMLEKYGMKTSQLNAGRLVDQCKDRSNEVDPKLKQLVRQSLEDVIKGKVVIAKRDPCLHRHSVRGMYVQIVDDDSFHINPIICGGFNADFDGDQMAIFLPITDKAQNLVREKMLIGKDLSSSKNDDDMSIEFKKDQPLAIWYMTQDYDGPPIKNPHKVSTIEECEKVIFETNEPAFPVIYNNRITTAGRAIFEIITTVPTDKPVTKKMAHKTLNSLRTKMSTEEIVHRAGLLGKHACKITPMIGKSLDISIYKLPDEFLKRKDEIFANSKDIPKDLDNLTNDVMANFKERGIIISDMAESGAENKLGNIKASFVAKGYVNNSNGEVIPTPVKTATGQGLSSADYYTSAVSGRSGLIDRSQMTANSGYMTRKLIYSVSSIILDPKQNGNYAYKPLMVNVRDKFMAKGLKNRTLWDGTIVTDPEKYIGQKVGILSPVYWTKFELGPRCLTYDIYDNLGSYNVGILAAQAIGEKGAQSTMRTFHTTSSKGAANFLSADKDLKYICDQDKEANVIALVPLTVIVNKEDVLNNNNEEMTFKSFRIETEDKKFDLELEYDFTLIIGDPDDVQNKNDKYIINYPKDAIFGSMKNSAGSTTGAVMQIVKLAEQPTVTNPDKLVELMYYNTLDGVPMWAYEIVVSQLFRDPDHKALPYRIGSRKKPPLRVGLKQVAVYENWRRGIAFENISKGLTAAILNDDDNPIRVHSDLDDIMNM